MSRILTASDRKNLVRLASELPKGSPERKAILAGLQKAAGTATDKQVRYVLHLMSKNGYSTNWMSSEHKALGATMRERQGKVEDWLRNMDFSRISRLIDTLK